MCASPLSPRHAQPDSMGGGLASRQMMHAPPSAGMFVSNRLALAVDRAGRRREISFCWQVGFPHLI
jgi:hypothetical protein